MDKKTPKSDPKYFYIVVLITLFVVGFVFWQIFFISWDYDESMTNPTFIHPPNVNLVFFDSSIFQDLNEFQRGDIPLLPWQEIKIANPFEYPKVPENRTIREWWRIFNLNLSYDEVWVGAWPQAIKEQKNPTLVLFENRWYDFELENSSEEQIWFLFRNELGEEIKEIEIDANQKINFRTKATQDIYDYVKKDNEHATRGRVLVIGPDDYDAVFDAGYFDQNQEIQNLFIRSGQGLSLFYQKITDISQVLPQMEFNNLSERYAQLESEFQEIERKYLQEEFSEEEVKSNLSHHYHQLISEIDDLENIQSENLFFDAGSWFLQKKEDLEKIGTIIENQEEASPELKEAYQDLNRKLTEIEEDYRQGDFTFNSFGLATSSFEEEMMQMLDDFNLEIN